VPGCWLKKGKNEVIVLDVAGPAGNPAIFGQGTPELDKLNLEEPRTHDNWENRPDLGSMKAVKSGFFSPGNGWQKVRFPATEGRYLALEIISNHSADEESAIAEAYACGKDGERISRESWTVHYADSEDILRGNHTADKVFDLQESTFWCAGPGDDGKHVIVIDLGETAVLTGFEYLPRAEQGAPGSIKDYRIYLY